MSMYIEDEELRTLYQVASTDHLEKIEAGLLFLEKQPNDKPTLEELLREAHSLKGDSRMLGVTDAESITHHIEEILSGVHKGKASFSPEVFDSLYQGVDAIKKIAREAITGEPSQVSIFHVVAQLLAVTEDSSPPVPSDPEVLSPPDFSSLVEQREDLEALLQLTEAPRQPIASPSQDLQELLALTEDTNKGKSSSEDDLQALLSLAAAEMQAEAPQETVAETAKSTETGEESYRFDTVRIEATRLDVLMNHAGELTVTQQRIARQLDLINSLTSLWEEADRETAQSQRLVGDERSIFQLRQTLIRLERCIDQMGGYLSQLVTSNQADASRLELITDTLETDVRKLQLLPLSTIFNLFPRTIRDIAKKQNKEVDFIIEGGDTAVDRRILEEMKAPLTHLLRNAIDHGVEPPDQRQKRGKPPKAKLILKGYLRGGEIILEVRDDGQGLSLEAIQQTALKRGLYTPAELAIMTPSQIESLVFMPGFSTRAQVTEISGRGVGLDVVRANVERLRGSIQVESKPGEGTTFRIILRGSRATIPVLVVGVGQWKYAIPIDATETSLLLATDQILSIEGKPALIWEGKTIGITWLADVFQHASTQRAAKKPCIILRQENRYHAVVVDTLLDYQEIQLKTQSKLLKKVRNLLGVTILTTGEVCHVLNTADLVEPQQVEKSVARLTEKAITKSRVLLVEDSLPIRTQLRRILEASGYDVTTAVDGADGFQKLRMGTFDAIVSDVEMPNLTGIQMTEKIRRLAEYNSLPIVLVTTLAAEADRRRGAEAGANAYLTKGDFDQTVLLETLKRLIS